MKELWTELGANLGFVLVSVCVVAALAVAAKLTEKYWLPARPVSSARRVCIVGICSALAAVLHMLDFPVPFLAPPFYKLDFSELPVLLCGFYLGPSACVACEGVKIVLKLLIKSTSTAFVGDLANFVVGCSFVLPAVIFYRAHKSRHNALIGLILGTVSMADLGSAFNAVYLVPKFSQLYGLPLGAIIAMGGEIWPAVTDLSTFAFFCVAPLNVFKGVMVSVPTMLLYKKVARPLFGIHK